MKTPFLLLAFLFTTAAVAQQLSPTLPHKSSFNQKHKITPPTLGVAERLNAKIMPLPKNRSGHQTLTATDGGARLSLEPLRLRVVLDSATGLPIFIERKITRRTDAKSLKNRGARLSAAAAALTTFQFLGQVRSIFKLKDPAANFTIARTETDDLGQMHLRLKQTYAGIPVYDAELMAHLTDGEVTLLNGRYQPMPDGLSTRPALALADASKRAFDDVRKTSRVRTFGDNIVRMKPSEGQLCVFPTNGGARLAYQITVRPNLLERWEYVIDAQTGEVLDKYDNTCTFAGPIKTSGKDLNGVTQSFQTYQQGNGYYLIDGSRSMFDAQKSKIPGDAIGALVTLDARGNQEDSLKAYHITSTNNTNWSATAISAHYNAGLAYEYFKNTFNRNSLNGEGGTIISLINVTDEDGKPMDNAFWNGQFMAYGNGDRGFKPLAGALDAAGHEMTHGVIQSTANLQYKNQSGAINESMADVFGVLIDRDDWTVGEDIVRPAVFPSGALRSLANPNQNGKGTRGYQPATMAQYDNTTSDNGGVHINSGIANSAFYKFATIVGKDKAEKVYYRALTTYLVRTSQFLDLRVAVIKAAGDLFGATGAEVAAAQRAFDEVGIVEGSQTDPGKQPDLPVAAGQDLVLLTETSTGVLVSTNRSVTPATFEQKTKTKLLHRPSVTDDGSVAYYVSSDKRIRSVNLTGTPSEFVVSDETIWDNVAISKDGTRLAALTADRDGMLYVYSFAKKKWAEFKLYNPTTAEGVQTGEVKYADSFEWNFSGEYIVYDAFNELESVSGEAVEYWDVGFINVWDNKTGDFAEGDIEKLFSELEDGVSIGNPSFSKNSPDIIAFDYVNESDGTYYVLAADLTKGDLKGVYENNTLGFPSFSRLDNTLVFSTEAGGTEQVWGIGLGADKVSPVGKASALYTNVKWPVWYTQATRNLPTKTVQTITFDAIDDRYMNEGDLTLKASCSSNLPVSFQVRSGPATITGTKLKITGTGAITVRAYHDGNDKFLAATPVDRTFNVLVVTGTEPAWSSQMAIYPNPASTTLTVDLPRSEVIETMTIRSLTGAAVWQPTVGKRQHTITLDVGQLPKGMYFLQIQTANGTANRKILKE